MHPATASLVDQKAADERQSQRELMARKRAAERDLIIPNPKEPNRRFDAMQRADLFLQTYFGDVFFEDFTQDRLDMLNSIVHAATYGGDQAIAGSRGEGKTKLAIGGALYLAICNLSRFPIVIGKNQRKSESELKTVKEKLQQSELLLADFPELCHPFKAVGGWSSRARMQTVKMEFTNLEIAADHLIFPTIKRWQLKDDWPDFIAPCSDGQIVASIGVDGGIRGTNYRDQRPSVAIIDDIEDRKAAESDVLIERYEEIIEKDIAGLSSSAERISRVFLCTIQNRKCNAYKFTDPKQKPSFKGKRYRKMITPPDRIDLVDEYISKRIEKSDKDPDAREAFRFWRDNQAIIEAGCVISNKQSHSKKLHEDGEPLELSAIQAYYNRVADWGKDAVATEIDNDPPETIGPQGMGLTAEIVASRLSGFDRMELPANAASITVGIDLGKYNCHWVAIAWWKGAGGCVVDYGVAEVVGTDGAIDNQASEPMIYRALLNWRNDMLQKEYVDAAGEIRKVDAFFIDSGTFTNAPYEFVRQVGGGLFHCAKGVGRYRPKNKSTDTTRAGDHMHAEYQSSQKLWLFNLDTDYWKNWVHERFLTPTFDENNLLNRGALSLFVPSGNRGHNSYAHHITAEELVTEFKEGRGSKTFWNVKNVNNHWLDATYYAAAAGRFSGIDLVGQSDVQNVPKHVDANAPKPIKKKRPMHGNMRQRPGGWMKGLKR